MPDLGQDSTTKKGDVSRLTDKPIGPPPGFNWGGFLLPFWWSIAHSAWLWAVIPFFWVFLYQVWMSIMPDVIWPWTAIACFFCLAEPIVFLVKGNEIATKNRRFYSIDEFRSVQKAWTVWGIAVHSIVILLFMIFWKRILGGIVFALSG
ncbi:MAG: hypothetical protein ACYC27_06485 [Armatimonadota bacterium]